MAYLIHFHVASLGEAKCAYRVYLVLRESLGETAFYFTYTSSSVRRWLSLQELPDDVEHEYLGRKSRSTIEARLRSISPQNVGLVVVEKDRRRSLLRLHRRSGFILNIDAKPPQSRKSVLYEKYIGRSIGAVPVFTVENQAYAAGICHYANTPSVHVVGTLKAPRGANAERSPSGLNRVVFVSVLSHEIGAIRRLVQDLAGRMAPLQVVLIPRYVGKHSLFKNGNRFLRSATRAFPAHVVVDTPAGLDDALSGGGNLTALYNAVGDVLEVLAISDIAVVCGSLSNGWFSRSKGHNFMEPLALGVPTFVGPYMRNWAHSVAEFASSGLLVQARAEELGGRISDVLSDDVRYSELSRRIVGSEVLGFHQQSDSRVADIIRSLFGA